MLEKISFSLSTFIFPPLCFVCERKIEKGILCAQCLKKLEFLTPPLCKICSLPLKKHNENICPSCQKITPFYDQLVNTLWYKEPLINLVHLFKYHHYDFFAEFFSFLMVEQLSLLGIELDEYDFITAVPSHPSRIKERDYSSSSLLAYEVSKKIHLPYKNVIYCQYLRPSQTKLPFSLRKSNIKGIFSGRKEEIEGKNVILVDDVVTTKATIIECSKVLKKAGARKILVITLAKSGENHS